MSQVFTFKDFSGGISDSTLGNNIVKFENFDNLVPLIYNNSAKTRPGSDEFKSITGESYAVDFMFEYGHQKDLLYGLNGKVFLYRGKEVPSVQVTALSNPNLTLYPTINDVIAYDKTKAVSIAKWGENVLLSDGENQPKKLYLDTSDSNNHRYVFRDAGLPNVFVAPESDSSYDLNGNILTYKRDVINKFKITRTDFGSVEGDTLQSIYLFYFVLYCEYEANGVLYKDFGPFTVYQFKSPSEFNNRRIIQFEKFPAIPNKHILETNKTYLRLYRTINAGTTPYALAVPPYGRNNINIPINRSNNYGLCVESNTDDTLQSQTTAAFLYALAGVGSNDLPPKSKYIHITRSTAFYAGIENNNRIIYQSKIGDCDSVPSNFFETVDDDIVGLSSIKDLLLVFCQSKLYSIAGLLDNTGKTSLNFPVRGVYFTNILSNTCGCLSHRSIVLAGKLIFWLGQDGIYLSDGQMVQKIESSKQITDKYKDWKQNFANDFSDIQGVHDEKNNKIYWLLRDKDTYSYVKNSEGLFETDAGGNKILNKTYKNKILLVLDLNFQERNHFPLYIWKGSPYHTNAQNYFNPKSIFIYNNELLRGEDKKQGLNKSVIVRHNENLVNDWDYIQNIKRAIIINLKTVANNLDISNFSKVLKEILFVMKKTSSVALDVFSSVDENEEEHFITKVIGESPIAFQQQSQNRPSFFFGDERLTWREKNLITHKSYSPLASRLFNFIKLKFSNATQSIYYDKGGNGKAIDFNNFSINQQISNIEVSGSGIFPGVNLKHFNIEVPNYYISPPTQNTKEISSIIDFYEGNYFLPAIYSAAYIQGNDPFNLTNSVIDIENRLPKTMLLPYNLLYKKAGINYYFPIVGVTYQKGITKKYSYVRYNNDEDTDGHFATEGPIDIIQLKILIDLNNNPFNWTPVTNFNPSNVQSFWQKNIPFNVVGYQNDNVANLLNFTLNFNIDRNYFLSKSISNN